jgi:hypothetical protein
MGLNTTALPLPPFFSVFVFSHLLLDNGFSCVAAFCRTALKHSADLSNNDTGLTLKYICVFTRKRKRITSLKSLIQLYSPVFFCLFFAKQVSPNVSEESYIGRQRQKKADESKRALTIDKKKGTAPPSVSSRLSFFFCSLPPVCRSLLSTRLLHQRRRKDGEGCALRGRSEATVDAVLWSPVAGHDGHR